MSTCDIGGGDASAVVGEPLRASLAGMIFDGNLESLPNTYLYTEEQARGRSAWQHKESLRRWKKCTRPMHSYGKLRIVPAAISAAGPSASL